jgi:sigma-E factor negative regulatory protein RseB
MQFLGSVYRRFLLGILPLLLACLTSPALLAQPAGRVEAEPNLQDSKTVSNWLLRIHEASRSKSYSGVVVVSSGGIMVSSRITHACDGVQQFDRVESLSGTPRTTYRKNDQVMTFSPQSKIVVSEKRDSLGMFPDLLKSPDTRIDQFYTVRHVGTDRIAGFEAEQVLIEPRDTLRFSYRVWSEKNSGLVIKMQTLDGQHQILEQISFSELQLGTPVSMHRLAAMMNNTAGYQMATVERVRTTAMAQGWQLKQPVAGFQPMNCFLRPEVQERALQWIFSDGLASVSLFIEGFDPRRTYGLEGLMAMGATHTLTQRRKDSAGDWWITVVGEVPPQTLQAFARGLERSQ